MGFAVTSMTREIIPKHLAVGMTSYTPTTHPGWPTWSHEIKTQKSHCLCTHPIAAGTKSVQRVEDNIQGSSVPSQKLVHGKFFQILYTDLKRERERGFPKSDNNINNLDELPTKSCEAGRKKLF